MADITTNETERDGSRRIAFRTGPRAALLADLEARAAHGLSLDLIARRDLVRYYHALRVELARVELIEGEAMLICDAMNGTITEPHTAQLLWAEISDAISMDGLDQKWEVDGPGLVAKLRALNYMQALALADAVERFWNDPNPARERVRAVGLVREKR